MSSVQLQQIDHAFGRSPVLRGLDLQVESGQYLVLLGASGGGKTTLLRIIAGLLRPDSGKVHIDGADVTAVPPRKRGVAMVFQHDALYPHLTVAGSIRVSLRGLSGAEAAARMREAATLTGIESLLDRYPHHLSGGQLRRAAIAKAVASRSGLRLFDEPLASLDGQARQSLLQDLLQWHRRLGGTTVHVTHDGQEAMRMADKIAVLSDGQIVQCDTPENLFRHPLTLAAARAVGSPPIQCFRAAVQTDTYRLVDLPEAECALSAKVGQRDVTLAVRPAALSVKREIASAASRYALRIPGTLLRQASIGHDRIVDVRCGDQTVTAIVSSDQDPLAEQEPVWVYALAEDVHCFEE